MKVKFIKRKSFSFNCSLTEGKKAKYYTGYAVISVDTFKSANTYRKYVKWDAVQDKNIYKAYTQGGDRFYFCLKGGFEFIKEDDSAYALSMIAVRIDITGELTGVYTRDMDSLDGEGDLELKSPEALEKILNKPFNKTFKPYPMYDAIERGGLQKLLDSGVSVMELYDFDDMTQFSNYTLVRLNNKYNIVTNDGKFASTDKWFDGFNWSGRRSDLYQDECMRKGKYGYLYIDLTSGGRAFSTNWYIVDVDGRLLSPHPFEKCVETRNHVLFVLRPNRDWTIMGKDGNLIYPNQDFTSFEVCSDDLILVTKKTQDFKQYNFVDATGCLISPGWFDKFECGYRKTTGYLEKDGKEYKVDFATGDFTDIT